MSAKAKNNTVMMRDIINLNIRYVRSVNIVRDLNSPDALDGYIITPMVTSTLQRLFSGLSKQSTQRAWRITGSYGSGKSALGLLLAKLLSESKTKSKGAGRIIYDQAPELFEQSKKLPRYLSVGIPGQYCDASVLIAEKLVEVLYENTNIRANNQLIKELQQFIKKRASTKAPAAESIIPIIEKTVQYLQKSSDFDGLCLLIDEMGQLIEYASKSASVVRGGFFQSLAEAASGSKKGFAVIGFLHQRFEDYADAYAVQEEAATWAKVAERFEDIGFQESFESTCLLLSRALSRNADKSLETKISKASIQNYKKAISYEWFPKTTSRYISELSSNLYPFHPATLSVLITLFRRFGQNERSIFSFLLSSEFAGFQEYLQDTEASPKQWYYLDRLCDYVLALGGIRTFDQERIKRWHLLQETLRTASISNARELACIKIVGLLNLLEPVPGIKINDTTLAFCLPHYGSDQEIAKSLKRLTQQGVLYKRSAQGEYSIWPQSSVDLHHEFNKAQKTLTKSNDVSALISLLPEARPIIAHRHYLKKGTLRTLQVSVVNSIDQLKDKKICPTGHDGYISIFPISGRTNDIKNLKNELVPLSTTLPNNVIIGTRKIDQKELTWAHNLQCWNHVKAQCKELRVDASAKREVDNEIEILSGLLLKSLTDLSELGHAKDSVALYYQGEVLDIKSGRELNQKTSEIFDEVYSKAPIIHNELINRRELSSPVSSARGRLMSLIFEGAGKEDLGISKTPPEKAIYLSVFKKSCLHRYVNQQWKFCEPPKNDPLNWKPVWVHLRKVLEKKGLVSISEVIEQLKQPPFGVRESITLMLIMVYLNVYRDELILKEKGTYVTSITEAHLIRLGRRPEHFEVHLLSSDKKIKSLLDSYFNVVEQRKLPLEDRNIAALTRTLYEWYVHLPEYTCQTSALSKTAKQFLLTLKKADDPISLIVREIPNAVMGIESKNSKALKNSDIELFSQKFKKTLSDVSNLLQKLRQTLSKKMSEIAGTPNEVPALRQHLCALSENLSKTVNNYDLSAFAKRTLDESKSDEQWIDSLSNLLGGKSIDFWDDLSVGRFLSEFERLYLLLTRVTALTHHKNHSSQPLYGVHLVDSNGEQRMIAVPKIQDSYNGDDVYQQIKSLLKNSTQAEAYLVHLLAEETEKRQPTHTQEFT